MDAPALRLDRVGLLLDQLTDAVELSRLRIDGIDDAEFLWEPTPDAWSIRPRGEAVSADPFGPGDHLLDHENGRHPFLAGPVSTIAWRVGHLVSMFAGRWEWTFGERKREPHDLVDFTPSATMLDQLWTQIDRWVGAVDQLDDTDLDLEGFGQYPYGLDPQLPFIAIVRWMNREVIHHLAEIALLRDLYAQR